MYKSDKLGRCAEVGCTFPKRPSPRTQALPSACLHSSMRSQCSMPPAAPSQDASLERSNTIYLKQSTGARARARAFLD